MCIDRYTYCTYIYTYMMCIYDISIRSINLHIQYIICIYIPNKTILCHIHTSPFQTLHLGSTPLALASHVSPKCEELQTTCRKSQEGPFTNEFLLILLYCNRVLGCFRQITQMLPWSSSSPGDARESSS